MKTKTIQTPNPHPEGHMDGCTCEWCKPQPPHTPTPWVYDPSNIGKCFDTVVGIYQKPEDGSFIAVKTTCHVPAENEADAVFIVRAVNAHEELIAASKRTLAFLTDHKIVGAEANELYAELADAIRKAEGR